MTPDEMFITGALWSALRRLETPDHFAVQVRENAAGEVYLEVLIGTGLLTVTVEEK